MSFVHQGHLWVAPGATVEWLAVIRHPSIQLPYLLKIGLCQTLAQGNDTLYADKQSILLGQIENFDVGQMWINRSKLSQFSGDIQAIECS